MKCKGILILFLSLFLTSCSLNHEKEEIILSNSEPEEINSEEESNSSLSEDISTEASEPFSAAAEKETEEEKVYLQMTWTTPYDYFGYVTIEDDMLYIDPIELIRRDDVERIAELGLDEEADMPSGYYFYDPDKELLSFKITSESEFHFIDWGRDFVGPEDFSTPFPVTNDVNLFIEYLETYSDLGAHNPFFIVVDGDCLKYLIEHPFA